jgi:superfamily II DNA or RNA helicase
VPATTTPSPPVDGRTRSGAALDFFRQTLRDYQAATVADALTFVDECRAELTRSGAELRRLYSSPTGTGKGSLQLALLRELRHRGLDAWLLSPSLEVLRGVVDRCGGESAGLSEEKLAEQAAQCYATTPTRFCNRIVAGERAAPDVVLYDEVHHAIEGNEVSGTLFALAPGAVWVGFTATPYRATPRATAELRAAWGEPTVILTYPEAVAQGYAAHPRCEVVPILDDDTVKIQGGEFQTKSVEAALLAQSRVDAIARVVLERCTTVPPGYGEPSDGGWWRLTCPTVVVVPGTDTAHEMVDALDRVGIRGIAVLQNTTAVERAVAYASCRTRDAVLVSLRVLGEGVDLPWLRVYVDASPTLSPVAWVQRIGRITRPVGLDEERPLYICTNRNLERHAYLLQGLVPREVVAQAQAAFTAPSKRSGTRAVGLEKLTRFKQIDVPLAGGVKGQMYALWSYTAEGVVTEYLVLLDPCSDEPLCGWRTVEGEPGQTKRFGRWQACAVPTDLDGFATSGFRGQLSEKQRAWWKRSALAVGLDPEAADDIAQRQFAALPLLSDTGRTLLRRADA